MSDQLEATQNDDLTKIFRLLREVKAKIDGFTAAIDAGTLERRPENIESTDVKI